MGSRVDQLTWFLIDAVLAASLVLTAVALVMVMTRQPVRRCALARGALLASLALIPLIGLRSITSLELARPIRFTLPWEWRAERWFPDRLTAMGQTGPGLSLAINHWVLRCLTWLALATAALKLAWLILGVWALRRVLHDSQEPSRATIALYQSIPFPRCRRPGLRVSSKVTRPALVGTLRPSILIPVELDRPETFEPLRLSLLHELVHARRRDPWFKMVSDLAQVIWFVLPPLWWIREQMRLDQEFLADQQAAIGFGPFGTYAASLVDLADASPRFEPILDRRQTGLGGPALSLRVLMLVRCPFPVEQRAPPWWCWAISTILVALTLIASSVTLQGRQPPAPRSFEPGLFQPAHGVFKLTRLSLAHPPTDPYPIPIKLPPRFDLTMDLWASSAATLAGVQVVGRPLSTARSNLAPSPRSLDGFHTVRVRLDPDGLQIRVDDRVVATERKPAPLPELLTIQTKTHQPILVRNLKLVW
ncbi:MAG: M56 family metallopeptidase [Isosphaeraceae bacterium]